MRRPVTNFQSAHDGEKNRRIEKYYEVEGESFVPSYGPSHDSVWSFHVWNEMYMKRPALNAVLGGVYGRKGADGWQAVDATPQELSRGGSGISPPDAEVYQMGPASLALLKQNADPRGAAPRREGWDHEFVISEVNADIQMWVKDETAATGWALSPAGCNGTEAGAFALHPLYATCAYDRVHALLDRVNTPAADKSR